MIRNLRLLVFIIVICVLNTGCHAVYSGTVVDAETGKPIVGALVFGQWTVTKGLPGLAYHKVASLAETETNNEGKFQLIGSLNLFADPPEVVILKDGYTAWRNDYIFPSWEKRKESANGKIMLERFKEEYSWLNYSSFIETGIMEKSPKFSEATNRISSEAYRRAHIQVPLDFRGKVVDAETGEPIDGAILLAIGNTTAEGISDKEGKIRISGNFPMLEQPPYILIYKKGYFAQSSWYSGSWHIKELKEFKWPSGYVFKMEKWDNRSSHRFHFDFMYSMAAQAEKDGKPLLMNSILWERDLK